MHNEVIIHTLQYCYVFPKTTHTLAGFEPESIVPRENVMNTTPRCQDNQ
jgi:hypothetical protein